MKRAASAEFIFFFSSSSSSSLNTDNSPTCRSFVRSIHCYRNAFYIEYYLFIFLLCASFSNFHCQFRLWCKRNGDDNKLDFAHAFFVCLLLLVALDFCLFDCCCHRCCCCYGSRCILKIAPQTHIYILKRLLVRYRRYTQTKTIQSTWQSLNAHNL